MCSSIVVILFMSPLAIEHVIIAPMQEVEESENAKKKLFRCLGIFSMNGHRFGEKYETRKKEVDIPPMIALFPRR